MSLFAVISDACAIYDREIKFPLPREHYGRAGANRGKQPFAFDDGPKEAVSALVQSERFSLTSAMRGCLGWL